MTDRIHGLLNFWFGRLGNADLPTSDRTDLWFGENETVKQQLIQQFQEEFNLARSNQLNAWLETPRGCLGLIILLDQFPRYIYRNSVEAFSSDEQAFNICLEGIKQKKDQALTLIERVFFYMPLVHSEESSAQEKSIRLYQDLVTLSLTETTQIYQLFLAYAYAHFRVIKEFGRFPQRNIMLGRESTAAELAFLKNP
jgi:uncharacterized protein (DUF924 family)